MLEEKFKNNKKKTKNPTGRDKGRKCGRVATPGGTGTQKRSVVKITSERNCLK